MNTITAFLVTYPKGWKNGYKKETLGTTTAPAEASVEECCEICRREFPQANSLRVSDEQHPAGWMAGSVF